MSQNTYSTDYEILETVLTWLNAGDHPLLVTVIDTWGSSPRRPGSMMAVHSNGQVIGSVSGGCVEDELVQQMFKGEFNLNGEGLPRLIKFGVNQNQTTRIGLPCGGQITLLIERLNSSSAIQSIVNKIDQQQQIKRRVCLTSGEVSLHPLDNTNCINSNTDFIYSDNNIIKTFGPGWRLLLIGAGDLTKRVAELALTLDYAVTICDPRPEHAANWQVARCNFLTMLPVEAIRKFNLDSHTALLTLSHTSAIDDNALFEALKTPHCFYVGALGSRRSKQQRAKRLKNLGLTDTQLQYLHAPVGLDIGSHTPAEIAIAIIADLIKTRNCIKQKSNTQQDSNIKDLSKTNKQSTYA